MDQRLCQKGTYALTGTGLNPGPERRGRRARVQVVALFPIPRDITVATSPSASFWAERLPALLESPQALLSTCPVVGLLDLSTIPHAEEQIAYSALNGEACTHRMVIQGKEFIDVMEAKIAMVHVCQSFRVSCNSCKRTSSSAA